MGTTRKPKPTVTSYAEIDVPEKKGFRGFANIDLTDSHKEWVKKLMDDVSLVNDYETELVSAGFKISLSVDYQSECFVASATGTQYIPACDGIAVSARAKDKEAAKLALYAKIVSVADWKLEPFLKSSQRPMDV